MPFTHSYSDEECRKIESDLAAWIRQNVNGFIKSGSEESITLKSSSSIFRKVVMYEVKGISYAESKKGVPFEHMAIQVGDMYFYHLVFEYQDGGVHGDSRVPVGVRFKRDLVENLRGTNICANLGSTVYESEDIMKIGKYLLSKFGDYSSVFWNCQHFARILARTIIIPRVNAAASGDAQMFETSNEWLAGFLFRVPIAGRVSGRASYRLTEIKSMLMANNIPPEYREILQFEYDLSHPQESAEVSHPRGGAEVSHRAQDSDSKLEIQEKELQDKFANDLLERIRKREESDNAISGQINNQAVAKIHSFDAVQKNNHFDKEKSWRSKIKCCQCQIM